jgi:hypothetical protein
MAETEVTEAGISEYLALAAATPRRIAASTAGHDNNRLSQPPAPGEWSVVEIFNHLRACEEVWMHSVHAMLAHENPNLQEIHPRQWIKTANPYTAQSFASSLQVFTLRRQALLITLEALSMAEWARECRIERKTHTIFSHVRRMVLHENTHCDEIDAILMK